MVQDMVTYTNQRIDVLAPKYSKENIGSVSHTCPEEIMVLMGILIQSGAKQDNKLITTEMFDPQHGAALYCAGASEGRFKFLLQALVFDAQNTRNERKENDEMTNIRKFFEKLVTNCSKSYVPGSEITVDEKLLGFRGRKCKFRYYIGNMPKKYGLKIIMACDARNSYMLNAIVDMGKFRLEKFPSGKLGEYYTMKLMEPYPDSGRNELWTIGSLHSPFQRNYTKEAQHSQKRYEDRAMFL